MRQSEHGELLLTPAFIKSDRNHMSVITPTCILRVLSCWVMKVHGEK